METNKHICCGVQAPVTEQSLLWRQINSAITYYHRREENFSHLSDTTTAAAAAAAATDVARTGVVDLQTF